jgi:hypothetical protein
VHDVVGELLYARNFYIALLTEDGERRVPVFGRRARPAAPRRKLGSGLTEYVIGQGAPCWPTAPESPLEPGHAAQPRRARA